MIDQDLIRIRGAREHNLDSVNVDIPRNQLVVFTGVSGSGKSSLAIDTIFAEGQRRYVESLSAYARQFLNTMEKPAVDSVSGLSPAIAIEQKTTSANPRSTVGTITEIQDYLRLLYARAGTPYSPATGLPIKALQVSDMVDRIMELDEGTRAYLLAPIVRGRKGAYRAELGELLRQGFQRVRIDGKLHELERPPKLQRNKRHDIELVVDRLVVVPGVEDRLADSLRTALDMASGIAYFQTVPRKGKPETIILSENFACPVSGFTILEIEPRLFSFNATSGACPKCSGLGQYDGFSPSLLFPSNLSVKEAVGRLPIASSASQKLRRALGSLVRLRQVDLNLPLSDFPEDLRNYIVYGDSDLDLEASMVPGSPGSESLPEYGGVAVAMQAAHESAKKKRSKRVWKYKKYLKRIVCQVCEGRRLRPEALAVRVAGHNITEVSDMSIGSVLAWALGVPDHLDEFQGKIAEPVLKEITERLGFLVNVGLDYLTLSRVASSLSGGESQRIRLASQIGSGLSGVLYVLDEPSIGLHQRDNRRLLNTLRNLRDLGNSVIVVEHDEEAIREADCVLDLGPGAGINGGVVVAQGTPAEIAAHPDSITGKYLRRELAINVPDKRRDGNGSALRVVGACKNNLKQVTVDFPLGKFICVTGVSGSGKSSLAMGTLYSGVKGTLDNPWHVPEACDEIDGVDRLLDIIRIDQRPIGRTPRSNPATYTGAMTPIRQMFAALPEARLRGFGMGRFSFNVEVGRCAECRGEGLIKVEMHFLPDVYVTCRSCGGKRYNRETLQVKYKEHSIADVLDLTIEQAETLFDAIPAIRSKLSTLRDVGLGYVKLGQPATTLSGGEAQRVKLSKELSRKSKGGRIYVLDEPTTGLHFEDIKKLLKVLHRFVDRGDTVVVIEHNLDVIKTADWVIDLGPEGGDGGGQVVVCGTPERVTSSPDSHTGRFLAPMLGRQGNPCAGKDVS